MSSKDENIFLPITFQNVYQTWSDVLYDLVRPRGRSVYDTFWQNDRSYYCGMTLIIFSFILVIFQVLQTLILNK